MVRQGFRACGRDLVISTTSAHATTLGHFYSHSSFSLVYYSVLVQGEADDYFPERGSVLRSNAVLSHCPSLQTQYRPGTVTYEDKLVSAQLNYFGTESIATVRTAGPGSRPETGFG